MPAQQTAKLEQPLHFAGYDLVHCLGRGGMGEVWSVVRRGPYDALRALAIKVMLPELSERRDYRDIFITEGRITMQLSSSNIVPVFELGLHDDLLFMVMDRIDGVNLAEFQRRVRNVYTVLPLDVVAYIIGEILAALFVAHEHTVSGQPAGVIHRDVKPANILVSSSGDIRLTDFGIAGPITRDSFRDLPPGTWRYMPPEQAMGRAERSSDLFAVGAILHELLSGRPFREAAQNTGELRRALLEYREVPTLSRVIPRGLERLRRGLLEPDPRKRFRTVVDAMKCLSEWRGFRYARLRLAKIYETAVGTRSSGFTDAHTSAAPSFLLSRGVRERREISEKSTLRFRRVDEVQSSGPAVDEDAKTLLRMPWFRRTTAKVDPWREPGIGTDRCEKPVVARKRWDEAGPHPAAPEPASRTVLANDGGSEGGRTVTPTMRLLFPVGLDEHAVPGYVPTEEDHYPSTAANEPVPASIDPAPPSTPAPDRREPRDSAQASGTIVPSERTPDLRTAMEQSLRAYSPLAVVPRPSAYMAVIIALLCALVGVSTAWFMSSRHAAAMEARP